MAQARTFAKVLREEPMLTSSILAGHADAMQRVERLAEQLDPGFFNSARRPSESISQYSEDSRGGNAPTSGTQARLEPFPDNVVTWALDDFRAEVKWDEFAEAPRFGDVQVREVKFERIRPGPRVPDEAAASDLWSNFFKTPAMTEVIGPSAFAAPNGWTPFDVDCRGEATAPGHRVDWTWTRAWPDAETETPNAAGIVDAQVSSTARFLVHEHKSPGKFPYGLLDADYSAMVQAFAESAGCSTDDAEEFVKSEWQTGLVDLSTYWELGGNILGENRRIRFLYPIIQIYVYMLRSFCKYGVLSTTDRTWFLKLDRDNVLHVTPAFFPTGIEDASMRYAYTCVLYNALTSPARLEMTPGKLWEIANTTIMENSEAWKVVLRRLERHYAATPREDGGTRGTRAGNNRGNTGAYEHSSGGPKESAKDSTADADREAELRELLPLKSDLSFPYAGGLVGVLDRYPEGQFGYALRVDTSGIDTVVKIMTPAKHKEDARVAEAAFAREMRVYKALRPIWGTHVPWFLYGGRHIFNDLIVATTYAGESLGGVPATEEIKNKAWGALMAVHDLGVAHRDLLLRNFVMDSSGTVRLIDFAQAKLEASPRDLQKDREDFSRAFSPRRSQARRGRLS